MATEYKLSYTATEIDEKLGKIDSLVSSVNGIAPDENGNVEILLSGGNVDQGAFGGGSVVSPYLGKTANFLGDSITALITVNTDKPYHSWVADLLGIKVNNYGVSGSSFATNSVSTTSAMHIRYTNMVDADLVVVAGGVNDAWHGSTLGEFGDTTGDTLYGALDILCKGLRKKYPLADIVFMTPTEHNRTLGFTMAECAEAIIKVCNKYAIPVYDNRILSGFYPQERSNYNLYTTDGLHWNSAGHEKVGKGLADFLLRLKGYPSYHYISASGSGDNGSDDSGSGETEVTLASISASYSGGNVAVGTAVTALTGIVVTATYSDGSKVTVTGYTLSGTIKEGNNAITVTYGGKTTTFTVTGVANEPDIPDEPDEPEKTLTSISATYSGGDVTVGTSVNDLTGIVVTARYSDGSTETVSGYALSGTIAEGSNTITVVYQGVNTSFVVTGVAEPIVIPDEHNGLVVQMYDDIESGIESIQWYKDGYYQGGSLKGVTNYAHTGYIACEAGSYIAVPYIGVYADVYDSSFNHVKTLTAGTTGTKLDVVLDSFAYVILNTESSKGNTTMLKANARFTIARSLHGCVSDSDVVTVNAFDSHTETLTEENNYMLMNASVTVMMGAEDISATAYKNGIITVEKVTSDIVITVIAHETITEYNGLVIESFDELENGLDDATWYEKAGAYNNGSVSWVGSYDHTGYIKLEAGTYTIKPYIRIAACIFNTSFVYESTISVNSLGEEKDFTLSTAKYLIVNRDSVKGQTIIVKKEE